MPSVFVCVRACVRRCMLDCEDCLSNAPLASTLRCRDAPTRGTQSLSHTNTHKNTHTHTHAQIARHSQTQVSGSTTKAEKINLANEIDLMRRADHANITLFHDAYRAKSNLWIVMEFCEGAVFWVFGWFCACDFVLGRRTRGCLKMTNPSVLKGRVCIFYLFC